MRQWDVTDISADIFGMSGIRGLTRWYIFGCIADVLGVAARLQVFCFHGGMLATGGLI